MNNNFLKIKIFIGVIILAVFVFSFLHSELGFLNHDDDNHSTHDHCTIVNGSTIPTLKTSTADLSKLKVHFIFIPKSVEQLTENALAIFAESDSPHYTQNTNKVYLNNKTFLI